MNGQGYWQQAAANQPMSMSDIANFVMMLNRNRGQQPQAQVQELQPTPEQPKTQEIMEPPPPPPMPQGPGAGQQMSFAEIVAAMNGQR